MILIALFRALPQVMLPGVRAALWRALALTLALFAGFGVLVWLGLRALFIHFGLIAADGFVGAAIATMIALLCLWLLFRAVAMAVVGLFADGIVIAVEQASHAERHRLAQAVPVATSLKIALRSAVRAIGWNLLALPLYILLLATGIGAPLVFLAVNAYLLGEDLSELVGGRHPDLPPLTRAQRWQLGLVSALLFLLPVVNLFAPVWSVAMAVHVYLGGTRAKAG